MTKENTQLQAYKGPENSLALSSFEDLEKLGELFYASGQFDDVKSAAQAMVKILAGSEYGFSPITSMSNIHFMFGKPVPSATLQASLIKNSGKYDYEVLELSRKTCRLQLYKKNAEGSFQKLAVEEFTWDDAATANLTTGSNASNWQKYTRNMLFARAITNTMRFHCPDLLRGEIGDPDNIRFAEYEDLPDEPEIVEGEAVEAVEETQPEEAIDGEVVEEAQEESNPDSGKQEDPPVDPEEAARAELLDAVQEKLIDLTGGDEKELNKLLKGRDPVQMPNDALSKLLIEITA